MPELIMERPKMSLQMHENLKRFILRERRKKKEQDEKKLREEKKKAEIKTQTLEQNKEQIHQLQQKLEDLQLKRRELFSQLKKVLNEETILKKNNRLPPVIGPGSDALNPLLMYSGHPGHPQLLTPQNQQFVTQPQMTNLPQPSPILSIGNLPSTQSSQNSHNNSNPSSLINKPQSPFHPPNLIPPHHLQPSNASNFLKYFQNSPMQISTQMQSSLLMPPSTNILNQNMSSPSSSPHLISSSPRHNLQQQPNIKRQRSPSPTDPLLHNQFLFNQSQLIQQRSISPGIINSSSPPIGGSSFNSPSSAKKIRNSSIPASPQSMQRQALGPTQQQQQSAFSSYLNRPGVPNFQSPSSQNKQTSNSGQGFQPNPLTAHTPPGQAYQMPRGLSSQPPIGTQQASPHAGLPPQFNPHYLNEQAKMILQQQSHPHNQQFMQQPYLGNISSIPMLSAAAAAAAQQGSNNSSSSGSIMTGFPIRNPNNQ